MNIVLRGVSALVLCFGLTACATVTRGTKQEVTFESTPPGAVAKTTTGYVCDSTPCTTKLARKEAFDVTFTKDGFKPATVSVQSRMQGGGTAGLVGNVLVGGFIGVGVDATSGALLDLTPNPVSVTLDPADGSN